MGNVEALIDQAIRAGQKSLAAAGDWLTGEQRLAAALEARDARTNELDLARRNALSPNAVSGKHRATEHLPEEAVEVLHRIASDPGRLTRDWANDMIAALGEEVYTELVGIAAKTALLDMFAWAMSDSDATFRTSGDPDRGEPARHRPQTVGDVGAWVAQSTGSGMANVSRSLSLVPVTNQAWVGLVQALYSRGDGFLDLEWKRGLSRPQVELVAARTTAELECFY